LKEYVIYAGVNGSGKSTLYHTVDSKDLKRVNSDEFLVASGGDWHDLNQSLSAMRESVRLVKTYLKEGVSFCQETTLTGNFIMKNIEYAKRHQYSVTVHYVGLESADLAVERVALRVAKGGHGIPEDDIRRRYSATLENLKKVVVMCNSVSVYDNTIAFRRIAIFQNGEIISRNDDGIDWFSRVFPKVNTAKPV